MSKPRTRFWSGTFGEWLAVFVVVAILVALFFPVRVGGGPSIRSACLSNVRQLSLGMLAYSGDWDGHAPIRDSWMDSIERYTRTERIDRCPAVKGVDVYGYAFNAGVAKLDLNASSASTTPLVYDSVNLGRNASDLVTSLPDPGRHQGKDCVAYTDGHARAIVPAKGGTP